MIDKLDASIYILEGVKGANTTTCVFIILIICNFENV